MRVLLRELARAIARKAVDEPVRQGPHEGLVLLEALRRHEPHHQAAVHRVHRRIERDEVLADRIHVAVLLDEVADVVTLDLDGKAGERATERVARRERLHVTPHLDALVPARHRDDSVRSDGTHRALTQKLVVRIRIVDERGLGEEVDVVVRHVVVVHGVNTGSVSQPRTVDVGARCAPWMSTSHSGKRLRISSSATRPSSRASDAPRQKWMPYPNARCCPTERWMSKVSPFG